MSRHCAWTIRAAAAVLLIGAQGLALASCSWSTPLIIGSVLLVGFAFDGVVWLTRRR